MDRPLDDATLRQARRRRLLRAACLGGGLVLAFAGARLVVKPSVERDSLRIGRVDVGPVEAVVEATGTVLPAVEEVLSSPVDARVLAVRLRPGASVATGETIVELDTSEARLSLTRAERSLALKANERSGRKIALETTLSTLHRQAEIKRLQLQTFEEATKRSRKLLSEGLVSAEGLRQAELDEGRTRVELVQLEEAGALARRSAAVESERMDLEVRTLEAELGEARKTLELAQARPRGAGVVTWVTPEEGALVHRGDVLARVADLSAFRVEAQASDVHAARLSAGLPAVVVLGDERLSGRVTRVQPAVRNGALTLDVALDTPSHPGLRSQQRVDVRVILDRKEKTLRVGRPARPWAGEAPDVFVLKAGALVRTPVRLGLLGADSVEIREGLAEGDQVVLSDLSDYEHVKEIRVR